MYDFGADDWRRFIRALRPADRPEPDDPLDASLPRTDRPPATMPATLYDAAHARLMPRHWRLWAGVLAEHGETLL